VKTANFNMKLNFLQEDIYKQQIPFNPSMARPFFEANNHFLEQLPSQQNHGFINTSMIDLVITCDTCNYMTV
jgi:hypothetical protein